MDSKGTQPFTGGMLAASTTTQQPSASVDNTQLSTTVTQSSTIANQPSTSGNQTVVPVTQLHNDDIIRLKKMFDGLKALNNKDVTKLLADNRIKFINGIRVPEL